MGADTDYFDIMIMVLDPLPQFLSLERHNENQLDVTLHAKGSVL
jgi:hypothetical protein